MDPTEGNSLDSSVCHRLSTDHGITAKPGQKIRCPFCGKKSFSIKFDDTVAKCFHPNCERYVTAKGEVSHVSVNPPKRDVAVQRPPNLTLAQYASAKQLPVDFLCALNVTDTIYQNRSALQMSYLDEQGEETAVRFRLALEKFPDGDNRFRWKKGATPTPYGLWLLSDARHHGYVVICEGESDAQTLWWHEIPALGIPGANSWKESWASYLDDISSIYVVIEPDSGGRAIQKWLKTSSIRNRTRLVRLPDADDPSHLHCKDPNNFRTALQAAIDASEPFDEMAQEEYDERASSEEDRADDNAAEKQESQAVRLVNLVTADGVELFHDDVGDAFAHVPVAGHREVWPCRSKTFKYWLSGRFWEKEAKAASSDALSSALNVIEAKARFDGKKYALHNRVACHEGAIWYDLADRDWRAVKVTETGWEIVTYPPTLFRRHAHQQSQPDPVPGGDFHQLLDFLNLRDPAQELLLLAYVVCCFVPDIPHPIPVLHGPQGSAKTTLFRMLRRLVDPSVTAVLSFPRDAAEFVQQLSHHWAPFYDNITGLSGWASDMLCRAVTGEGFSKRMLYSDDEDVIYQFRRCVGLNGINVAAHKPDLLDRCILFSLERIATSDRKPEETIWSEFDKVRPFLLGAIFDALSSAMAIRDSICLSELPRMADFALWGSAVARALGYTQDQFIKAYDANGKDRNEEALDASPVAAVMRELMDDQDEWEGTSTELLSELDGLAEQCRVNIKSTAWPKAAHVLSRRLREVAPNLAAVGIEVGFHRDGRGRSIVIQNVTDNSVTSVTSDESSLGIDVTRDGISDGCENASPVASHVEPSSGPSNEGSDANDASDGISRASRSRQDWGED